MFALLPDPAAQRLLREAVRSPELRLPLWIAANWQEMHALTRTHSPALAVFDPYPAGGLDVTSAAEFHHRFASMVLLAYGDFNRHSPHDVIELTGAGVLNVIVRGEDDTPDELRRVLSRALAGSGVGIVLRDLGVPLPPDLTSWLRKLLLEVHQPVSVAAAARLFHSHPNTLRAHLRAAGLPPVAHMIVWARLFRAAHLLGNPARTTDSVAAALAYPSTTALRNQLRRYTGFAPREVRRHGGLACVLEQFRGRHASGEWKVGGAHGRRT